MLKFSLIIPKKTSDFPANLVTLSLRFITQKIIIKSSDLMTCTLNNSEPAQKVTSVKTWLPVTHFKPGSTHRPPTRLTGTSAARLARRLNTKKRGKTRRGLTCVTVSRWENGSRYLFQCRPHALPTLQPLNLRRISLSNRSHMWEL